MRVTRLSIASLRAIQQTELQFGPGMNLIVGINGAGKTTILKALAVCLSEIVRCANGRKLTEPAFAISDIRDGAQSAIVSCHVEIDGKEYEYYARKSRQTSVASRQGRGLPREQTVDTPDKSEFAGPRPPRWDLKLPGGRPFALLFATQRAVAESPTSSKGDIAGGFTAAFAGALDERGFRLHQFAEWMRAQQDLSSEGHADAERRLVSIDRAVPRCLPGYSRLRATDEEHTRLLINHGEWKTLLVDELPDTARSTYEAAKQETDEWMKLEWRPDATLASKQERYLSTQRAMEYRLDELLADRLPGYRNLRRNRNGQYVIDQLPVQLEVRQLSDGERGILSLVLEITKRLAQANPELEDPAAESEAVILIDELDLHLHPRWQREIVQILTSTFPKCQFIATTHSPQIIGEVPAECIQIYDTGIGEWIRPDRSNGVDSNRILRLLMDTDERSPLIAKKIEEVEDMINEGEFDSARAAIAEQRKANIDIAEWSILENRIARLEAIEE